MRIMPRIKAKMIGLTMAALVAASPLAVISMSMVTGCGGGCLPPIPCECRLQFAVGMLAIWLLRGGDVIIEGRSVPGLHCWDLNGNGVGDPAEDSNNDGLFDVNDCQGADGGTPDPLRGIDGVACWDLNGNLTGDPNEDVNGDGLFNALDCRGPAGPPGQDGSDGQDGDPGLPSDQRFDWFIEDFFTYGRISDDIAGQGEVIQIEEPVLDYVAQVPPIPIGFRTSVPEIYHEGKPVTLRVFLWRECDLSLGVCESLAFDIFRALPGMGISRYGERRWLRLDTSGVVSEPGMLVFDLPLNTPEPAGLGFDNDLFAGQMLAFEVSHHVMDACYTILGAEVFESESAADTAISNVAVFKTEADLQAFCGTCNIYSPVDGQCDDDNAATLDFCNERPDSEWGQCVHFAPPVGR